MKPVSSRYSRQFLRAGIALGVLALSCATSLLAETKAKTETPKPPCCREGLPPGKYSAESIYKLDATWTSDVGREIKLEVLRGRPQVIALFFTSCQHSCPLIVADMKAIDKALPRSLREKVDFLLVSIDPTRDTPEALHAFRLKHELPTERWTLLLGSPEATKALADLIGFNYLPGSPTQFAHSLLISIANPGGVIVFQRAGTGRAPDDAVEALIDLTRAPRRR